MRAGTHDRTGDLLTRLSEGRARAEGLTDAEFASIAVETPLLRALRWAASLDGATRLAIIGPAGAGKSFAARSSAAKGFERVDLPPLGAAGAAAIANLSRALDSGWRVLLTARQEALEGWASGTTSGSAATFLREVASLTGLRPAWPAQGLAPALVLDLSTVKTTSAALLEELLRRVVALADDARDESRERAAAVLRERNVREWARAVALEAERIHGPLVIGDLWFFVAHLASGEQEALARGHFDVAGSVAGRLLRHPYAESLLATARAHDPPPLDALALAAGFEGGVSSVYCSDARDLGAQGAVYFGRPPAAARDTFAEAVRSLAGGAPAASDAASGVALRQAKPNPFTQSAFEGALDGAIALGSEEGAAVLPRRAWRAFEDRARAQGLEPLALAAREARAARPSPGRPLGWPRAGALASPNADGEPPLAIGILLAAAESGALDEVAEKGGGLRARTPADLSAPAPPLAGTLSVADAWTASDCDALGEALTAFRRARVALVDSLATRTPEVRSPALAASLSLERDREAALVAEPRASEYLRAYSTLIAASIAAGGDLLERSLALDVALAVSEDARRGRLLPLHPLMVAWRCRSAAGGLPPVIAARHRRVIALSDEGPRGYFHGAPLRWPSVSEQRSAASAAFKAWLDATKPARGAEVLLDLVDPPALTPLLDAIAATARDRGLEPRTLRARVLVTDLARAAVVPSSVPGRLRGIEVRCEPSVRFLSELRPGSFSLGIAPASLAGRQSGTTEEASPTLTSYLSALRALGVDARPHRLEAGPAINAPLFASLAWSDSAGWSLALRADRAAAPPQAEQPTLAIVEEPAPRSYAEARAERVATTGEVREPAAQGSRDAPQSQGEVAPPEDSGAAPESSPADDAAPRLSRGELRARLASLLGRASYDSDSSLVADVLRDVLSRRRSALRHIAVGDVAEALAPVLEGDVRALVSATADAMVSFGDLLSTRSGDRGPLLLELSAPGLVNLSDGLRCVLLGEGESTLSAEARRAITLSGPLRTIDAAKHKAILEELRFFGARSVDWREWAGAPPERSPEAALRGAGELAPFKGDLGDYEVFDPRVSSDFFAARLRHGVLEEVLDRDGWAVGTRSAGFDAKERRLFRRADGVTTSAPLVAGAHLDLIAACARRSGVPLHATEANGVVRLYFQPPRWLERLLALGEEAPRDGAFVARKVPAELLPEVKAALSSRLWCEVRRP